MKIKECIIKYNRVTFLIIFLFSSYIHLLSSESVRFSNQLTITNNLILFELVNSISANINTNFENVDELSHQDTIKIINTISPYCVDTEHIEFFFNSLYRKNSIFKLAADFLIDKAVCNINNVTFNTISRIERPSANQPTNILNQIVSPLLKDFIINCAIDRINFSYKICINGHTDTIRCFDICTLTHMAITGSKDKTCVWNLNQGICVATLAHGASFVCFNANGSFFSTLQYYLSSSEPHNTKTVIEQWKIDQSQIAAPKTIRTHMLLLPDINPYRMTYSKNNSDNILELTHWSLNNSEEPHYHLSLYQFHENNIITLQETKDIFPLKRQYQFNSETYSVDFSPTSNAHSITIVKYNCHNVYLLRQAIANTPTKKINAESIARFERTLSYTSLTEHEKNTINQWLEDKK